MVLKIILLFVVFYFFAVFVLSRVFIPYLRFKRISVPEKIPKSMEKEIKRIKQRSKSKREFLLNSYNFISDKYVSKRLSFLKYFNLMFNKDVNKIWNYKELPCANINYLLRVFLIKSNLFKEEDIKIKYTIIWLMIHQYFRVDVGGELIDVDLWGKHYGVEFGKHAFLID